jgi:farnesyl-diphosphate farnesyltransferase
MQYRMYVESRRIRRLVRDDADVQYCYSMLNKVSRSFAIVIQMLPECLRDAICVFYLTLRALDTVEDDMALPNERKLPLLHTFHDKLRDECAPTRSLQSRKNFLLCSSSCVVLQVLLC